MKSKNEKKSAIQEKALEQIKHYFRVGVSMSVGVGKTLLGLKRIQWIVDEVPKAKILVVAPKVSIFESWKRECDSHNISYLKENIHFSTYLSLGKINLNQFDYMILDECHNLLYSHDSALTNYSQAILGLTGTPPARKGTEKYEMVDKYCPIKFEYQTTEAVDEKLLNDYRVYVHCLELNTQKNIKRKKKDGGHFFVSERDDYDYVTKLIEYKATERLNILRMSKIKGFKTKENYVKKLKEKITKKCIIFANTIKQAKELSEHSYVSKNSKDVNERNLDLFNNGDVQFLSCVEQLSEGINIKNLESGIIMHSYGNERKANQKIGRLLRLPIEKTAIIHMLVYKNTIDESWLKSSLNAFDEEKIKYIGPYVKNYNNG